MLIQMFNITTDRTEMLNTMLEAFPRCLLPCHIDIKAIGGGSFLPWHTVSLDDIFKLQVEYVDIFS